MKIKTKIIVIELLGLIIISVSIGVLALKSSKNILVQHSYDALTSARESKANQMSLFFRNSIADIEILAKSNDVKKLIKDINHLDKVLNINHKDALPIKNPIYKKFTQDHEDFFQAFIKQKRYYDVFLIDAKDGHVVYTAAKESDYGANLVTGDLNASGLGKLFRKVKKHKSTVFVDMAPYPPSQGKPALFIGTPVINTIDFEGILAIQISDERIREVMQERAGYGKTQETYFVGPDKLMRSDSYLNPKHHSLGASFSNPQLGSVNTDASREALRGKHGTKILIDYNGNSVLSSYAPFTIAPDLVWALISEIDEAEVMSGPQALQNKIIAITIFLLVLTAILLMIIMNQTIILPLKGFQSGLLGFFKYLNEESKHFSEIKLQRNDEIGEMIEVVNENIITVQKKVEKEKELYSAIEELNKVLETRVEEEVKKNKIKDQQMLQQAQMAQMGEMISIIAHQWKQPLNAISATVIALEMKEEFGGCDIEYRIKRYHQVSDLIKHLSHTMDDFRGFFRPNKQTTSVKLEDVVIKSLSIIRASIESDGIKIIEDYNSNIVFEIYENELLQVILNLLKNAQDAFKENKVVNPYIKIKTIENGIQICDNAGGIPESMIDNIFKQYFSTKDEKMGTGLGLYMSKIIIEEHHRGKINVICKDGGSCFIIDLSKKDK